MRAVLLIAVTVIVIGSCAPSVALPAKPINDAPLQEELFAADRAYARAVADSGIAAWTARFAPDIIKPGNGGLVLLRGVVPVGANDKVIFDDPSKLLVWEPTDAASYGDQRTGITVGRSAWVRRSARTDTLSHGRYLTLWRKQSNGTWKILMDTAWDTP